MSQERAVTVVAYTADPWESACPHLRIVAPCAHAGMRLVRGSAWEGDRLRIRPECVADGDVIVVQRDLPRWQDGYARVVQQARALGKPVIFELDDLITDLPPDHPDYSHYVDARLPMLMAAMEADAVTVSTLGLADHLRKYGLRVHVLPNYLDDGVWQLATDVPRSSSPLVIGYAGGRSHAADLASIAPALLRVLRHYGDRVQLRIWGNVPVPEELAQRGNVVRDPRHELDYGRYAARFSQPPAHIYLAPLVDTSFNRAKSAVKYLEYSATGVCGVFGACEPYRALVNGHNGLLAEDQDTWEAALRALIEDAELRDKIGAAAIQTVRDQWLLSQNAHRWLELYLGVLEHRGEAVHPAISGVRSTEPDQPLTERETALKAVVATLMANQERLTENARHLEAELQMTRGSITWRATEPVRKAYGWVERARSRRKASPVEARVPGTERSNSEFYPMLQRAKDPNSESRLVEHDDIEQQALRSNQRGGYSARRFFWTQETFASLAALPLSGVTDIVTCIGRSTGMAEKCLRSIQQCTESGSYRIKLVVHRDDIANLPDWFSSVAEILPHELEIFNFAMANNLALRQCPGDVVLLNDDTEVMPGWLERLREDSRGIALTGARTGRQCSGNPDMWGDGPTRITWYPVNMFCAFIPGRVREVVGLLEEEFFYYGGEDVDYSCRTLQHGFPLVVSSAFVKHAGNQTFKGTKQRLMQESDKILYERFGLTPPFALDSLKPTVSVVTATHNRSSSLPSAVRSILAGAYPEQEVVVVDDCSSDDTPAVIADLQREDPRVVGIRLPKQTGAVGAREIGLRASAGQFLALMDDDDVAWPERILAPLQFLLTRPDLDVAYCGFDIVSDSGRQRGNVRPFSLQDYLQMKFDIGLGVLLLRRSVLVNAPLMRYYDRATDYDWVFRINRRGYKLAYCPAVVLDYNRRGPAEAHLAGTEAAERQHKMIQEREQLVNQLRRK